MAKKKAKQQDIPNSIFDHFAQHGRDMSQEAEEDATPDVKTLLARIEASDRTIAEMRNKGNEGYPMVAPTQGAAQQTYVADPAKLQVDLTGLPDQMDKPEEYNREYTRRVNAAIVAQAHAVGQQLTQKFEQERAAERLWAGFKAAHPEWAKFESLVETVSNRVATDLQARGVDLQRFMTGTPEKFYAEVANSLQQSYGKLVAEGGEGEDEDGDEAEGGEEGAPDSSRAANLGSDGKTAPKKAKGVGAEGPGPGDMFEDLKAVQRRMRIY